MVNVFDIGDVVRASASFTDSAGTAVDPTAVFCVYRDPSGNAATLTYGVDAALVRDSAGHYHADINVDESGDWYYRWYSTGTGQAAEEANFRVRVRFAV